MEKGKGRWRREKRTGKGEGGRWKVEGGRGKWQDGSGKRQEGRQKRQETRGKRQEGRGKREEGNFAIVPEQESPCHLLIVQFYVRHDQGNLKSFYASVF